jgi:hypothetical protein
LLQQEKQVDGRICSDDGGVGATLIYLNGARAYLVAVAFAIGRYVSARGSHRE